MALSDHGTFAYAVFCYAFLIIFEELRRAA